MRPTDDVLIGVYYDNQRAREVTDALHEHGFYDDQIRVTLCEAEVEPTTWRSRVRTAAFLCPGVLIGLTLGLTVGRLAAFPLAAACLCTLSGGFVNYLFVLARRGQCQTAPLFRGIVSVRPDGRDEEAAAILLQYAGCPVPEQAARARSA